jgi:hypothetical protein
MKTLNCSTCRVTLIGLCLAAANTVMANSGSAVFSNISITALNPAGSAVSTINGAFLDIHAFNDAPASVPSPINGYPGSITLSEANVVNAAGTGLERDIWYFSNNGGASPYQFTAGDYFSASFGLTLSGGVAGKDLEGGFIFSNPSGVFGGDDQVVAIGQGGNAGTVVQFGGPSYYPFSPAAGGYPGVGGSVPNYVNGTTINMTFIYKLDPVTQNPAFEYAVNGQFAASAPGNNYFDLGGPVGSPGDYLGGYFQIAPTPEPSTLTLLGLGALSLTRMLRRRA